MNFAKFLKRTTLYLRKKFILYNAQQFSSKIERIFSWSTVKPLTICQNNINEGFQNKIQNRFKPEIGLSVLLSLSIFQWIKEKKEKAQKEKLNNTLKESITCIQLQQYDKAENMLDVALQMAEDIHSENVITEVYDAMANLAMEREEFTKAENLFSNVKERLSAEGYTEDSVEILHVSLKIAQVAEKKGEIEKAIQGFKDTLDQLEKNSKNNPADDDMKELLRLTKNWFGELLMKQGNIKDAKKQFMEAYNSLEKSVDIATKEAITLLNNLAEACIKLREYPDARQYLKTASDLLEQFKDTTQEALLKANMGLVYLHDGLILQAEEICAAALQMGKQHANYDVIRHAENCLQEIKSFKKK